MSARGHISLKTKLAAAISVLLEIPHEHQQLMTEDQVLSLVQWDHYPIRRDDGLNLGMTPEEVDHHSNLYPRSIMSHRVKTAKKDIPQMAKSRRCRAENARHAAAMAVKSGDPEKIALALEPLADPRRARPKPKRKMPSRPFNSKGKRKMRGGRFNGGFTEQGDADRQRRRRS